MDNQHRHIKGYRELSESEIATMNRIKEHGCIISALVEEVRNLPNADQRWVSIAKTDLQTGFMALTRSVAQPTTF